MIERESSGYAEKYKYLAAVMQEVILNVIRQRKISGDEFSEVKGVREEARRMFRSGTDAYEAALHHQKRIASEKPENQAFRQYRRAMKCLAAPRKSFSPEQRRALGALCRFFRTLEQEGESQSYTHFMDDHTSHHPGRRLDANVLDLLFGN